MSTEFVGRGSADGLIIGRASGNGAKIGFFGTTPVVIQTASTAPATTGSTASSPFGYTTSTQATAIAVGLASIITNAAAYGLDL